MDLIHIQDAKMEKANPSRGKGYTDRSCCITNIVINNKEAKINLESGSFCTFVGKNYLDRSYTNWQEKFMAIEGIKLSSASQNMHPLGILEVEMIFAHPVESIRLQVEFFVINNCTSQHLILGNDYLNIYGIDINNHKDRYLTIGENKRQKFAFPLEKIEITVIKQVKNVNREKESLASDNEKLGAIKRHKVDLMLDVERPYPPLSKRQAYPASARAKEELENHVNELMKMGFLRNVGHNEEVEIINPVIINSHNDK
ncbi:hypothetical protein O181_059441 [Austropuccinia psidii MF-1]|uniref:Uncharacterized protein n=1 Tax=Austropuccinia psidii MF-1 TaxID=1389203 RepID=A0A9Q3EIZ3_9BASI|nr:hypothetical protein [Austropuccinia psidii MF-1]